MHAVGIYGSAGAGYANELGLDGQIDIIQGTLQNHMAQLEVTLLETKF